MKITIIGAGNIGGATAIGLATYSKEQVTASDANAGSLSKFEKYKISTTTDNIDAASGADVVIVAVKPWIVETVLKQLASTLDPKRQILVSMAPGVTSEDIKKWMPSGMPLAYVIPNTAIEVGESMTFISPITTSAKQTSALEKAFSTVGTVMTVDERHLAAGTALASCGIAYALRYIRAASEGGVELGFFAAEAEKIVSQTVRGAASILAAHNSHPEVEIDKVTTPGGLTIKGLNAMEENGFTNSVIKGLTANSKK